MFWDVGYQREEKMLQAHNNEVTSVVFSLNCKYFASGSWDNTVMLWNLES
jgi:WD40 repeat protein